MSKMYKYTNPWTIGCEDEIWFTKERYMDGSLAIEAWCEDGPYTTVTVCLSRKLNPDEAFVDTNNNAGMDRWLEKNGIAKFTGVYGRSGFCTYPLMRFNLDKIDKEE